mmetsp:Transcript_38022/g.125968  ORF Transcript_38022/g.125968 Transcript_38022/m.125968 type:complete len:399 (+) Transcript_38022:169-1365(+)
MAHRSGAIGGSGKADESRGGGTRRRVGLVPLEPGRVVAASPLARQRDAGLGSGVLRTRLLAGGKQRLRLTAPVVVPRRLGVASPARELVLAPPHRGGAVRGGAEEAASQASDACRRRVVLPDGDIDEHGQHLVCDAEHRVASGSHERAAVPSGEGDCDSDDAREGEQGDGAGAELRGAHCLRLRRSEPDGGHREEGERVRVQCRAPRRREAEVRPDDMLPIRHLHREDAKVRADPTVRSKAGQLPLRVGQDVRGRACDKQQQRGEGARRRQLAAEEEVVEERDDDGAAGAEDDERLDVAVLQRLHVAVDGAHKHARVREVRPHLLPLKAIDGGEAAGAEEEAEEGADGELYRRDEGRSRNRVDAQLVDDEQRAGSGGEAERRKNRLAALEGAAEHREI